MQILKSTGADDTTIMGQSTKPSGCPLNRKLQTPTVQCADIVSVVQLKASVFLQR